MNNRIKRTTRTIVVSVFLGVYSICHASGETQGACEGQFSMAPEVLLNDIRTGAIFESKPMIRFNSKIALPLFTAEVRVKDSFSIVVEPSSTLRFVNPMAVYEIISTFEERLDSQHSVQVIKTSYFELHRIFNRNFRQPLGTRTVGDFKSGLKGILSFCYSAMESRPIEQTENPRVLNLDPY